MNQLKDIDTITYDTMLIIYQCFNIKHHQLIEYANKTQRLTEFLVKNNAEIVVPEFIINEIKNKGIRKITNEFIKSKQLANLPKNPDQAFILGIEFKVKMKLSRLQTKEWFTVIIYQPPEKYIDQIYEFFKELKHHPNVNEFLKLKNRRDTIPSFEDMAIIAFSKEMKIPIISNDADLTFFSNELCEKGLSDKIFNLSELEIYNN